MVYELRRTTYMKTLKLLSKIEENREIIFDKNFFHQMKECSLEMEVYASKKYSLQGTTQGRYLTGGVPPVRFSM